MSTIIDNFNLFKNDNSIYRYLTLKNQHPIEALEPTSGPSTPQIDTVTVTDHLKVN